MRRLQVATFIFALALPFMVQAIDAPIDAPEANRRCAAGETGPFEVRVPNGKVTCACNGGRCEAQTFTDAAGNTKAIGEALNFLQQAMGMIQSLLGKGGGGSGSGGGSVPSSPPETMDLPSLAPPAANFIPENGGVPAHAAQDAHAPANLETKTDTAIDAVVKDPAEHFLEAVSKGFSNITDRITEVTVGIAQKTPPQPATAANEKKLGSERPQIKTTEGGKAIEIGVSADNTGVAGFYGINGSTQTQGLSLVGRLCITRPWANSFISALISSRFFDGLCDRGGYQVGPLANMDTPVNGTEIAIKESARIAAQNATNVLKKEKGISCAPAVLRQGTTATIEFSCGSGNTLSRALGFRAGVNNSRVSVRPQKNATYGIICSDGFEQTCDIQVVNPRVRIWSEPKLVRLGARATIRWDTADVEKDSCTVKGPSFSETGSFGGASTVPISGPSTYVATCTALDGEQITESVTADLAL